MELDNIFQYVMDNGSVGGIIIADNLEEAMEKIKKYANEKYPYLADDRAKALVWSLKDNSHNVHDVYEIFNE